MSLIPESDFVKVFAYGSNMLVDRMHDRVDRARVIGTGFVTSRRLHFHKRSVDGSGKANAFYTGNSRDRIWGVVYELSRPQQATLDRFESLGVGYEHHQIQVRLADDLIDAYLYAALDDFIDDALQPYRWYHDFVVHGARQHRLPESYLDALQQVQPIDDPDLDRERRNRRLLSCE